MSISGLNNDPIKAKNQNMPIIPQSDKKDLPRFLFDLLLVAQKHSGHTLTSFIIMIMIKGRLTASALGALRPGSILEYYFIS